MGAKLVTVAMRQALEDLKVLLIDAGLKDGSALTDEEVKSAKDVLFWRVVVVNTDAAKKETYVTYNIMSAEPVNYQDGKPRSYEVTAFVNVFTRKEDINDLLVAINTAAETHNWSFDLREALSYNPQLAFYAHTFELRKLV